MAGSLPILALVCAWVLLVQAPSANQTSHYALIRALASGTARIDSYASETIDKSQFAGHIYSNKAPGLALAAAPVYLLVQKSGLAALARRAAGNVAAGAGVRATSGAAAQIRRDRGIIWTLTLWAAVLPAAVLLLLLRAVAERTQPGYGALAAVAVGAGTLLMPFASLLYSHVLAATFGFAGFAVLFLGRPGSARRLLAAGALCGLAITTEYPLALVAGLVGLYVIVRDRSLRSVVLYAAGVFIGLVPLGLYDLFAFGSVTHLSYVGALPTTSAAASPHQSGFFGVGIPQARRALEVLLAPKGLLVLTPFVAAAVAGVALIRRGPFRWEIVLAGAAAITFLVYNAGYFGPLGGDTPGPRFLIAALPFTVLGGASALRRWPGPALALLAASVGTMVLATITKPQLPSSDLSVWTSLAGTGHLQYTLLSAAGLGHGWGGIIPVLALVAVALTLAIRRAGLALTDRALLSGLAALGGWLVLVLLSPHISPGSALPAGAVGAGVALIVLAAARITSP
ncbi:MAG: hypothetical protein ACRDNK_08375 [Solirubrobacteraceae bacterium]